MRKCANKRAALIILIVLLFMTRKGYVSGAETLSKQRSTPTPVSAPYVTQTPLSARDLVQPGRVDPAQEATATIKPTGDTAPTIVITVILPTPTEGGGYP